jgi:hypothetical protein
MTEQRLNAMIEIAARVICDPALVLDALPQKLASKWPDAQGLELTVALASAADAVLEVFDEAGETGQRAQLVWRQAAMIGADVHYLVVSGAATQTAADLLVLWQSER